MSSRRRSLGRVVVAALLGLGILAGCAPRGTEYVYGVAPVDAIDILILESFPVQIRAVLRGTVPLEFSGLRQYGVAPIIRGIDHYVANRSNAYLFEFRVGEGAVLATSLAILDALADHGEARYLLERLMAYVRGDRFAPAARVPRAVFLELLGPRRDARGEDSAEREQLPA